MQNQRADSYKEAFTELRKLIETISCKSITLQYAFSDFQQSLQIGIYSVFPKVRLKGCWFHFNQAIIRKLFSYTSKKSNTLI